MAGVLSEGLLKILFFPATPAVAAGLVLVLAVLLFTRRIHAPALIALAVLLLALLLIYLVFLLWLSLGWSRPPKNLPTPVPAPAAAGQLH